MNKHYVDIEGDFSDEFKFIIFVFIYLEFILENYTMFL